jgi:carbonic anhydrase
MIIHWIRPVLSLFLLIAIVAADEGQLQQPDLSSWTYDGLTGPSEWGRLSYEFVRCEVGRHQSPIDIQTTSKSTLLMPASAISNGWQPRQRVPVNVTNSGHTILVVPSTSIEATIDGRVYRLAQFHFHTPSEHRVDGKFAAMEVHFVHQARDNPNKLAVLGILFDVHVNATSPFLDQILLAVSHLHNVVYLHNFDNYMMLYIYIMLYIYLMLHIYITLYICCISTQ